VRALTGSTPSQDRNESTDRGALEVTDRPPGCLVDPILRNDPIELLGELLPKRWQWVVLLLVLLEFRGHA
jgi:hypothetical protein